MGSVVACFASTAHAAENNYTIELGAQTYQANNAVSADQFDADFAGYNPQHSQLYALGENLAYIQASRAGYTLQAYKKQEIFINAGRETGQLYADINARVPPSNNRPYAINFDGYGIEQTGIGISKTFALPLNKADSSLTITPAARVYNINRYREIQAGGFAAARADGSYDIAIQTAERDTQADFTFPLGNSPSGMGYAFDVGANWQVNPALQAFAKVSDLLNYNSIKNAPTTVQTINSNVNQFDADGFLNYNPAIQGRNSRETYNFSLPVKTHLGVLYATNSRLVDQLGFDIRHIQGLVLPRVSAGWVKPFAWLESVGVGYEAYFEAIDLAANFKYGGVRLGFDSLSDENRQVEFLQVYFKTDL
ncbi:MAG: DUF5723 family protein [Pseudomonadota bacterium]